MSCAIAFSRQARNVCKHKTTSCVSFHTTKTVHRNKYALSQIELLLADQCYCLLYTTTHNYSIHCPKKSAQTSSIGSALISLSLAEYTRVCSYEWVYFANWIALTSIWQRFLFEKKIIVKLNHLSCNFRFGIKNSLLKIPLSACIMYKHSLAALRNLSLTWASALPLTKMFSRIISIFKWYGNDIINLICVSNACWIKWISRLLSIHPKFIPLKYTWRCFICFWHIT